MAKCRFPGKALKLNTRTRIKYQWNNERSPEELKSLQIKAGLLLFRSHFGDSDEESEFCGFEPLQLLKSGRRIKCTSNALPRLSQVSDAQKSEVEGSLSTTSLLPLKKIVIASVASSKQSLGLADTCSQLRERLANKRKKLLRKCIKDASEKIVSPSSVVRLTKGAESTTEHSKSVPEGTPPQHSKPLSHNLDSSFDEETLPDDPVCRSITLYTEAITEQTKNQIGRPPKRASRRSESHEEPSHDITPEGGSLKGTKKNKVKEKIEKLLQSPWNDRLKQSVNSKEKGSDQTRTILRKPRFNLSKQTLQKIRSPASIHFASLSENITDSKKCGLCQNASIKTVCCFGVSCCETCQLSINCFMEGTFSSLVCQGGCGECQLVGLSLKERCEACWLAKLLMTCAMPNILHDRLRKQLPNIIKDRVPTSFGRSFNVNSFSEDNGGKRHAGDDISSGFFGSVVDLPGGWKRKTCNSEVTVVSPSGEKFRSISKLEEYLKRLGINAEASVLFGNSRPKEDGKSASKLPEKLNSKINNVVVTTLPGGWTRRIKWQLSGDRFDTFVSSPDGRTFRSCKELSAYFRKIGKVDDINKYFPVVSSPSRVNSSEYSEESTTEPVSETSERTSSDSANARHDNKASDSNLRSSNSATLNASEDCNLSKTQNLKRIKISSYEAADEERLESSNMESSQRNQDSEIPSEHQERIVLKIPLTAVEESTSREHRHKHKKHKKKKKKHRLKLNDEKYVNDSSFTEKSEDHLSHFDSVAPICHPNDTWQTLVFTPVDEGQQPENHSVTDSKTGRFSKEHFGNGWIRRIKWDKDGRGQVAFLTSPEAQKIVSPIELMAYFKKAGKPMLGLDYYFPKDLVRDMYQVNRAKQSKDTNIPHRMSILNKRGFIRRGRGRKVLFTLPRKKFGQQVIKHLNVPKVNSDKDRSEDILADVTQLKSQGNVIGGPRVKNVCRSQAQALGMPRALFPSPDDKEEATQKSPHSEKSKFLPVLTPKGRRILKKTIWCHSCPGCTTPNCRKCVNCLDMKKYGGPGTKKKPCIMRKCQNPLRAVKAMDSASSLEDSEKELKKTKKRTGDSDVLSVKLSSLQGSEIDEINIEPLDAVKEPSGVQAETGSEAPVPKLSRSAEVKGHVGEFSPSDLVNINYWQEYDAEEMLMSGFPIITSVPYELGSLCFRCGSAGTEELLYCFWCCEGVHPFCLEEGEGPESDDEEVFWICKKCVVCSVCGASEQNDLMQCSDCKLYFHIECLGPSSHVTCRTSSDGSWMASLLDLLSLSWVQQAPLIDVGDDRFFDDEEVGEFCLCCYTELDSLREKEYKPKPLTYLLPSWEEEPLAMPEKLSKKGIFVESVLIEDTRGNLLEEGGFCLEDAFDFDDIFKDPTPTKDCIYLYADVDLSPKINERKAEDCLGMDVEEYLGLGYSKVSLVDEAPAEDSLLTLLQFLHDELFTVLHYSTWSQMFRDGLVQQEDWQQIKADTKYCTRCLKCEGCGSPEVNHWIDIDSLTSDLESPTSQTDSKLRPFCSHCVQLRQRNNYCPICLGCYEDNDFDLKMMECGHCKEWIHSHCEGLNDEYYQILSMLPDSVEYICRLCKGDSCHGWIKAVEKELKKGLQSVLNSLLSSKHAKNMLRIENLSVSKNSKDSFYTSKCPRPLTQNKETERKNLLANPEENQMLIPRNEMTCKNVKHTPLYESALVKEDETKLGIDGVVLLRENEESGKDKSVGLIDRCIFSDQFPNFPDEKLTSSEAEPTDSFERKNMSTSEVIQCDANQITLCNEKRPLDSHQNYQEDHVNDESLTHDEPTESHSHIQTSDLTSHLQQDLICPTSDALYPNNNDKCDSNPSGCANINISEANSIDILIDNKDGLLNTSVEGENTIAADCVISTDKDISKVNEFEDKAVKNSRKKRNNKEISPSNILKIGSHEQGKESISRRITRSLASTIMKEESTNIQINNCSVQLYDISNYPAEKSNTKTLPDQEENIQGQVSNKTHNPVRMSNCYVKLTRALDHVINVDKCCSPNLIDTNSIQGQETNYPYESRIDSESINQGQRVSDLDLNCENWNIRNQGDVPGNNEDLMKDDIENQVAVSGNDEDLTNDDIQNQANILGSDELMNDSIGNQAHVLGNDEELMNDNIENQANIFVSDDLMNESVGNEVHASVNDEALMNNNIENQAVICNDEDWINDNVSNQEGLSKCTNLNPVLENNVDQMLSSVRREEELSDLGNITVQNFDSGFIESKISNNNNNGSAECQHLLSGNTVENGDYANNVDCSQAPLSEWIHTAPLKATSNINNAPSYEGLSLQTSSLTESSNNAANIHFDNGGYDPRLNVTDLFINSPSPDVHSNIYRTDEINQRNPDKPQTGDYLQNNSSVTYIHDFAVSEGSISSHKVADSCYSFLKTVRVATEASTHNENENVADVSDAVPFNVPIVARVCKEIDDDCLSSEASSFCMSDTEIESIFDELEEPRDLLDIKEKLWSNKYISVIHFHIDIMRVFELVESVNHFQNFPWKTLYFKNMKDKFPWFDCKNPNIFTLIDNNQPFPFPSEDHCYAHVKPKDGNFTNLSGWKGKALSLQNANLHPKINDNRKCVLCNVNGDSDPQECGRLLYLGQDEWIHVNCSLWSSEVYEEEDGGMQNVYVAISRGRMIKCNLCQERGATVGCCHKSCQATFHFVCARKVQCFFGQDKRIFCNIHASAVENQHPIEDLRVRRCVFVIMDAEKRRWKQAVSKKLNVTIGSLTITNLGKMFPDIENNEVLIPADYCCTRMFWSTKDPSIMVKYTCRTKRVNPYEGNGDGNKHFGFHKIINHDSDPEVVEKEMKIIKDWHREIDRQKYAKQSMQTNIIPPHMCPLYRHLLVQQRKQQIVYHPVRRKLFASADEEVVGPYLTNMIQEISQSDTKSIVIDSPDKTLPYEDQEILSKIVSADDSDIISNIVTDDDDNEIISMVLRDLPVVESSTSQSPPSRVSPLNLEFIESCNKNIGSRKSNVGEALESQPEEPSSDYCNNRDSLNNLPVMSSDILFSSFRNQPYLYEHNKNQDTCSEHFSHSLPSTSFGNSSESATSVYNNNEMISHMAIVNGLLELEENLQKSQDEGLENGKSSNETGQLKEQSSQHPIFAPPPESSSGMTTRSTKRQVCRVLPMLSVGNRKTSSASDLSDPVAQCAPLPNAVATRKEINEQHKIQMKRTVIKKYPLRLRKHSAFKSVQIEINETIEIPSDDDSNTYSRVKRKWPGDCDGALPSGSKRQKRLLSGNGKKSTRNNEPFSLGKDKPEGKTQEMSDQSSHQVLQYSDDHNNITVSIVNNNSLCRLSKRKKGHRYRRKTVLQLDGAADPSSSETTEDDSHSSKFHSLPHSQLAIHIKQQSLAKSSPGEEGPYKCPKCKRLYRTRDSYTRHIETCTFEIDSSTSTEEESEKANEVSFHVSFLSPEKVNSSLSEDDKMQTAEIRLSSLAECSREVTNIDKLKVLCSSPVLENTRSDSVAEFPLEKGRIHRQVRIAMRKGSDDSHIRLHIPSASNVKPPSSSGLSNEVFVPPTKSPIKFYSAKKNGSPRKYTNIRLFKGKQGYQYRRALPQIAPNQPHPMMNVVHFPAPNLQPIQIQQANVPINVQSMVNQSTYVQSGFQSHSYQNPINSYVPVSNELGLQSHIDPIGQVVTVMAGPSVAIPQGYTLQYVGSYRESEIGTSGGLLTYSTPQSVVVPPIVMAPQPAPLVMPQVVNTNITYAIATAPESLVINQPTSVPSYQYFTQPQGSSVQQIVQPLNNSVMQFSPTTIRPVGQVQPTVYSTSEPFTITTTSVSQGQIRHNIESPQTLFSSNSCIVQPMQPLITCQSEAVISPIQSSTSLNVKTEGLTTVRPIFPQPVVTRSIATVAPAVFTPSSPKMSKVNMSNSTLNQDFSDIDNSRMENYSDGKYTMTLVRPRPTYSYRDAMSEERHGKQQLPEDSVPDEKEIFPLQKVSEEDTDASDKEEQKKQETSKVETQSFKLVLKKDEHSGSKFNIQPTEIPDIAIPSPEVKELRIKAKVSVGPKRKKPIDSQQHKWGQYGKDMIWGSKDTTNELHVNEQIPNLSFNFSPDSASANDTSLIDKPKAATPEPYIVFELTSEDGFKVESRHVLGVWQKVFAAVAEARENLRSNDSEMSQANGKSLSGLYMLGLTHNAVQYLLEQLPGAKDCHKYAFQFHRRSTEDDFLETTSGCARSETFKTRSPYDIFSWLASKHRRLPNKAQVQQEEIQLSMRRATSLELPMAMRYRHLCETAREAVGVFRSSIHGRGLFCKRDIDSGEMVIEYAGQVIRSSLCDMREKYYESKGIGCYMFRIDEEIVIDATMHGNAARFINHSCDPNCYSRVVDILGKKHIIIFALRRILRGEELTYDYKFPIEEDKIPCSCGARRCRKYLN